MVGQINASRAFDGSFATPQTPSRGTTTCATFAPHFPFASNHDWTQCVRETSLAGHLNDRTASVYLVNLPEPPKTRQSSRPRTPKQLLRCAPRDLCGLQSHLRRRSSSSKQSNTSRQHVTSFTTFRSTKAFDLPWRALAKSSSSATRDSVSSPPTTVPRMVRFALLAGLCGERQSRLCVPLCFRLLGRGHWGLSA